MCFLTSIYLSSMLFCYLDQVERTHIIWHNKFLVLELWNIILFLPIKMLKINEYKLLSINHTYMSMYFCQRKIPILDSMWRVSLGWSSAFQRGVTQQIEGEMACRTDSHQTIISKQGNKNILPQVRWAFVI